MVCYLQVEYHCVDFVDFPGLVYDSFSEASEESSLSSYELARLERIKENKKVWQDLKDIVSFVLIIVGNSKFHVFLLATP